MIIFAPPICRVAFTIHQANIRSNCIDIKSFLFTKNHQKNQIFNNLRKYIKKHKKHLAAKLMVSILAQSLINA